MVLLAAGPAPVSLQYPSCTAEEAVSAIARDGFVILRNAVQAETCDELLSQLQPHIDATAYATDDGLGKTTRRMGAVVARAPASWELAAHPMLCV